jgi:HTH-type transcriptional regulator/antitoxin HigA
MALKLATRTLPATYFKLVKQFPLAHLQSDEDLIAAQDMIDRLLEQDLDEGAQAYLSVLTDLVEAYENEHEPIPDASEADVLRELMRSNQFSQARLAEISGIAQSTLSAVLNRGRSLTKDQVVTLAKIFRVSPSAFLPA